MNETTKIEIPVEASTAAALVGSRQREAVGRLVDRLVRPGADDPLIAMLDYTALAAREAGLTGIRSQTQPKNTTPTICVDI
jgi:hypothetical protein